MEQAAFFQESISSEVRTTIIDGHIIAIDLSEPMDRIIDKDEDLDYLDDYRLMNPYILEVARQKISVGGDAGTSDHLKKVLRTPGWDSILIRGSKLSLSLSQMRT